MRKLLNTLYITSPESYLSLDGENVVILEGAEELGRVPLHNLEAIVSFGYRGVSPALMGGGAVLLEISPYVFLHRMENF